MWLYGRRLICHTSSKNGEAPSSNSGCHILTDVHLHIAEWLAYLCSWLELAEKQIERILFQAGSVLWNKRVAIAFERLSVDIRKFWQFNVSLHILLVETVPEGALFHRL
jgi:hypothetical protein